jgi:hypothetical protein
VPLRITIGSTNNKKAVSDISRLRSSLVLAADNPYELARFYADLLLVEPLQGQGPSHWRVPWPDGGFMEIYAPSHSRPQPRQSGRLAACLQRSVAGSKRQQEAMALLQAWLAEAIQLGACLQESPRLEAFGAEAWLLDPEANRLLLLVQTQVN